MRRNEARLELKLESRWFVIKVLRFHERRQIILGVKKGKSVLLEGSFDKKSQESRDY